MKVPVTNDTGNYMHVGPVTIPPYETRDVEETYLPSYVAPDAEKAPAAADHLVELAGKSVGEIELALRNLSEDDLERLEQFEIDGKNRVTALRAITEEKLNRAQAKFDEEVQALLGGDTAELIAKLPDLTTDLLNRLNEVEIAKATEARADLVEAIDAVLVKRSNPET